MIKKLFKQTQKSNSKSKNSLNLKNSGWLKKANLKTRVGVSVLCLLVGIILSTAAFQVFVSANTNPSENYVPESSKTSFVAPKSAAKSESASFESMVAPGVDLTINKFHTGSFYRSALNDYSFTVTNIGTVATSGTITLTDTLPIGMSVNNGAAGSIIETGTDRANWTCNSNSATPQVITCTSSTSLAIGASTNFGIEVYVSSTAPASLTNNASVSGGGEPVANNGNNSDTDPTSITTQPTFPGCDSTFYLTTQAVSSGPSQLRTINFNTNPYSYPTIGDTSHGIYYNAMGYRAADNYIYAIGYYSNNTTVDYFFRIGSDGIPVKIGRNTFNNNSGAFGADGFYYVLRDTFVHKIDVSTVPSPTIISTVSTTTNVNDTVMHPSSGLLYSVDITPTVNSKLLSIVPATGAVSTIGATFTAMTIGSHWMGADGILYGLRNTGGLYRFDLTTGTPTLLASSPRGSNTDGAICINATPDIKPSVTGYKSVKLTTDVNSNGLADPGDTLEYTLTYVNTGNAYSDNFQINDTLPSGVTITSAGAQVVTATQGPSSTSMFTTATANSGYNGTTNTALLATGATLAHGGDSIKVAIPVTVNSGFSGTLSNQASGSGSGITSNVLTDNIDNTTTGLPSGVTVPSGSTTQTQTAAISPTTINVGASISGKVFEDFNYGGGAGRDFATSGGSARQSARVELYNSSGAFVTSTLTDSSGNYSFTGLASGNYTVRVVNSTVTSSRAGYVAGLLPVQTFRTDASTGTAVADTNRVGGETPTLVDAGNGSTTLAALTTATTTAQSIAPVTLSANVTGVNFGFNFDTIVSTRDSGQGSLRQFITNSNALTNSGLAQTGQTPGKEVSIFMIPNGSAVSGLRAGLTNQLTSGVAIITTASTLPTISDADTSLDGTTQTTNVGNTNSGTQGTGGTVGTDAIALSTVSKPEVEIKLTNTLSINSSNTLVQSLAIYGGSGNAITLLNASGTVINQNFLGTTAGSFTDPGAGNRTGLDNISLQNTVSNATITNNLIGFATNRGISMWLDANVSNLLIQGNEINSNNRGSSFNGGGVEFISGYSAGLVTNATVKNNLIANSGPVDNGIELANGVNDSGILVENNTISNNSIGIFIYNSANANLFTIRRNIVTSSVISGIVLKANVSRKTISQNSTYDNTNLGINFVTTFNPEGVTPNNGTVSNTLSNNDIDYPIITNSSLTAGTLRVIGFVGTNPSGSSTFGNSTIEVFIADNSPADQNGEVILGDGKSQFHGEGKTYIGSCSTDANGLFDCSFSNAGTLGLVDPYNVTATATDSNGNTSEFGATVPDLTIAKSHSGDFTVGTTGTYSFTVTNSGAFQTNGTITVTDTLPTGLSVPDGAVTPGGTNAANWSCSAASNVITCTSTTVIAASSSSVFNFAVNVGLGTAIGTNSITNNVSVSGGGEINTSNNTASNPTTILSPDLTIAKSHTGNFTKGSTGAYTLTVSNSGTAATSGTITVTDTLPTGLSIADGAVTLSGTDAANWSCSAASNVITCTSSTAIAVSGTSVFSFTINVSLSAPNSVTNTATVSGGNEATSNNGNNSGSDPTSLISTPPNVELVKSCPNPANCTTVAQLPGTDLTYQIQFTNTGGLGAANMTIVDAIPANTDYKIGSATSSLGTTGLTIVIEFSNDYDALNPTAATWIYTPVSGGGGASAGYDSLVKAIRWRVTSGTLSNISPNNVGSVSFVTKIK